MTPTDKLPKEMQEQIKEEANKYSEIILGGRLMHIDDKLKGYAAGATAWAERAHGLVDALESLESLGWQNWQAQAIAEKALQQFKDGKGKEVENGQ